MVCQGHKTVSDVVVVLQSNTGVHRHMVFNDQKYFEAVNTDSQSRDAQRWKCCRKLA